MGIITLLSGNLIHDKRADRRARLKSLDKNSLDYVQQLLINDEEEKIENQYFEKFHIEKWDKIGLLYGIKSNDLKLFLSVLFEQMLQHLIMIGSNDPSYIARNEQFETIAFPIIRRLMIKNQILLLYKGFKKKKEIDKRFVVYLYNDIREYMESQFAKDYITYVQSHTFSNMDSEAELVAHYSNDIFRLSDYYDHCNGIKINKSIRYDNHFQK